ncbi:MAG: tRNA (adenosine(37)-N6)-dimethylallyltransferase MiaA [Paludibacteraceae bacterium]|nr:tRNA (adenosine(37)-N6)-dimethylallyltransferase MiaA [Paludibacteraceae bacterium]
MDPCSKLVVITGPTGVGKTELTLKLAERWGCPILNADSRQIYREIPIGTAAPTSAEQARATHYFVGTKSIAEDYNAGTFERDCWQLVNTLAQQPQTNHVVAILSGGSMLYIDAVCHGLDDIPNVDTAIRKQVQTRFQTEGLPYLQEQVKKLDPAYWAIVDQHNPQRLMHCIEVSLTAGRPYSTFRKQQSSKRPLSIVKIALFREREQLYERINARVEQMIADGLETEARNVWQEPIPNSLNTVGYKELFAYFRGESTREEAIQLIKQNSRHYAKRQMTWLRKDKDINWLNADLAYEEQIQILETLCN